MTGKYLILFVIRFWQKTILNEYHPKLHALLIYSKKSLRKESKMVQTKKQS